MKILFLIMLQCYATMFSGETKEAVKFIEKNAKEIKANMPGLTAGERRIAMAIVAPEISQYSSVTNFMELRSLFITYRNFGRGDFSVGYFQMKPSFIEALEREIRNTKQLNKKYKGYLISGDEKSIRTERLNRLSTLDWQLKYLEVFVEIAKQKTSAIKFKNTEEKLRYWATLYNSGFNSNRTRVAEMQKKRYFPRNSKQFNYADVAVEFYNLLSSKYLK